MLTAALHSRTLVKRALAVLAAGACLVVAGLPHAAMASAATSASAKFEFIEATITPGTTPQFIYTVRNLPAGSVIELQRQSGSSQAWKNVERLNSATTYATAPALAPGLYGFRVLLTDQHRTVFATSPQTLTVVPGSSGSNCELCAVAEDLGPYVFGVILALFG